MTTLTTLALIGTCTYYAPGVMERVVDYRAMRQMCPECIGYVALMDCEHLGRTVTLARPGHRPEGPFLVADCAQAEHRARLKRRGLVAEVDWLTARRWRMRGPIPIRVMFGGAAPRGVLP